MPVDRRRESVALFIASFLILSIGAFWGLPAGKAVTGALVILDGGVPYRDFWTMYAPGQFYAIAALYSVFGQELLVQALAACLVTAGSAVAFLALLRRLGTPRLLAYCLSAVFVLMFWRTSPELEDYPPALLLLLLAINRVVRYFQGEGTRQLWWTGIWLGLAACFKHDVAAYVAIGTTTGIVISWIAMGERRPPGWTPPIGAASRMIAAAVAAALPLALWTAWSAGPEAWHDIFVFPATVFNKVRGEPFPRLIPDLGPALAFLADITNASAAVAAADSLKAWITLRGAQGVFLVGVAVALLARRQLQPPRFAVLVVFLASMPFFWAAAHVQQNTHPYTLAVLGTGVAVIAWSVYASAAGTLARLVVAMLAVIYAAGLVTTAAVGAAAVVYQWPGSRVLDLSGFRGIRVPAHLYESFHPLGAYIRSHTSSGERIYTGLVRHDAIVINNSLLYAIAGRPPCCGFTELHPGVGDRAPVQQEIIRRLEANRVRAVVLWEFGWPTAVLEARKQHTVAGVPDAGSTLLDQYIATHYDVVERYGEFLVLWRRDAAAP